MIIIQTVQWDLGIWISAKVVGHQLGELNKIQCTVLAPLID